MRTHAPFKQPYAVHKCGGMPRGSTRPLKVELARYVATGGVVCAMGVLAVCEEAVGDAAALRKRSSVSCAAQDAATEVIELWVYRSSVAFTCTLSIG